MPNRIIRGDLLESDRYNSLTHDSERLLFIELLLLADDYGIVPVNVGFLRRRTTPCATKNAEQVTQLLSALADADLLRVYSSDRGGQFAFIPRFDNRPQALKPKWPVPPAHLSLGAIEQAQANSKGLYRKQVHSQNAPVTHSYVAPETETETETEKKLQNTYADSGESAAAVAVIEKVAKATHYPKCPVADVIEVYHAELPTLPRCAKKNSTRERLISARWREIFAEGKADTSQEALNVLRGYFAFCRDSRFLTGKVPSSDRNRPPFTADLSWLMGPDNFAKVVEGKYHR